jgi:pilus assembly protein Flp/PilA
MRSAVRHVFEAIIDWFLIESRQGITEIEYAILASLIAVAIITAVALVGTKLTTTFTTIAGKL